MIDRYDPRLVLLCCVSVATVSLVVLALVFVVPLGIAYWVYGDAKRRGSEYAANWAISMFLFAALGFLPVFVGLELYHSVRNEIGPAE
jgi:cbb3-type cytochrome oxidase subunit 3